LPQVGGDANGSYGGVLLSAADPIGRLSTAALATAGSAEAWRGASIASVWRGWPVHLRAAATTTQKRLHPAADGGQPHFVIEYTGAQFGVERNFDFVAHGLSLGAGAWLGRVGNADGNRTSRKVVFASVAMRAAQRSGVLTLHQRLGTNLGSGKTSDSSWTRALFLLEAGISSPGPDISFSLRHGLSSQGAPVREQFLIGGEPSPHLDPRVSGNLVEAPILRRSLASGHQFTRADAELSGLFPFTLYGRWTWPDPNTARYYADMGLFFKADAPRLPQIGAPGVSARAGAGIVLAGEQARRAALFGTLSIRP
jgi:hypothetical protein